MKRVLSKCHVCRRYNAKLGEQVTVQLPMARVSSDSHRIIYPFAAVGLDYFGPLYVTPEWAQNNIGEECYPKQALWMHIYLPKVPSSSH